MYVLLANIITVTSGASWTSFLPRRLLQLFGMNRSKLFRDEFNDDNVAEPHFVKDDGSTAALPRPDLSADTLMGPAGCLWSTVPDMLKWAKEYLYSISGLTE
jgi:CubicO group peptidase (beta-lactamase class C family)